MSSRLEDVRNERRLSRAHVARKLGISEQTVYRMEKGKTEVKDIHLRAFAHLYEVPVDDLQDEEVAA